MKTTTEELRVIKRDGRQVDFDSEKIRIAIEKAMSAVHEYASPQMEKELQQLVDKVIAEVRGRYHKDVTISEIQSVVENVLICSHHDTLAEAYVNYRTRRDFERSQATDINFTIKKLINKEQTVVNENANKNSDVFNTQRDLTAGIVGKSIGLKMLPPHVANAHQKGDIHFHDLDYQPYAPMTNCCLVDVKGMLRDGFKLGNAVVDSPKSIQTAAAQISQIIANVASCQYGGTSINKIDEVLAPYAELNFKKHLADAKKFGIPENRQEEYAETKTVKDIYDSMQSLEYEINTLFTSNGQTPFTTFGFGLGEDWYAREIQKAIFKNRLKGLGKEGRTAIFPKLVFTLKRGLNLDPGDPNYDVKTLALECATKRMYPDVLSYDKIVELTGSFKAPMGCRSFLQGWKDENGQDVTDGRMNLGVVSLNLPRIALESRDRDGKGDFAKFWDILDEKLGIIGDALVYRIQRVKQAVPANAPILYQEGAWGKRLEKSDSVDELFKHRRATISLGYIGLYEVGSVFYGPNWEDNPEAKKFTLDVMAKLKEKTVELSDKYDYHFSVYSTPAESLTDRFCRLDTEKFGIVKDITDKEYYTNSFHYDIRKNPTPFEKLDFEKDYPIYCSGGFIHYCEYPILQQNPKALEAVWDYAYDRVGYLGTNTPIDHCYECNFEGDFEPTERGFQCPNCGNSDPEKVDVVKRVCGYLGNPQARPMVKGRHKEISARVKHMNGSVGHMPE